MIKKLGVLMTSVNLAGSVIGMGNLEFPYFMRWWGFFMTMIFFVLVFFLMYTSCQMLLACKNWTGKKDYSKISLECFGKYGIISHICIMLYNTGVCVAFVVIYFTTLDKMLKEGLNIKPDSGWSIFMNKYL